VTLATFGIVVGCGGSQPDPNTSPAGNRAENQPGSTPESPTPPGRPGEGATMTGNAPGELAGATKTPVDPQPVAPQPAASPLSDAEIVAVTSAANNGEIEMAKVAKGKAKNAKVMAFATMMIQQHGEAEAKGKKIAQASKITPAKSDTSNKLESEGKATIASLSSQKPADFDKAYMESQLKAHRDVLSLLDDKLLPNAKAPELKTHLDEVRKHVASHLAKAEEISQALESGGKAK